MRHLLFMLALGCGVTSAAAMRRDTRRAAKHEVKRTSRDSSVDLLAGKGRDCGCPSKKSLLLAKEREKRLEYCHITKAPPCTPWDDMLNAPRTMCFPYTCVDYPKESALSVCASLGLAVADDRHLPRDVRACVRKCAYVACDKYVQPSSRSRNWEEYTTDNPYGDDSLYNSLSSSYSSQTSGDYSVPKSRQRDTGVLCKQVTCQKCQAPELLTFEDGEAESCSLFVDEGKGNNFVYRGFNIKNAGIYDPWKHRCDNEAICLFQSDIDAIISKPHVMISSQPLDPTSISRIKPFALISMFLTLSSPSYFSAKLIITAYRGRNLVRKESVTLTTGCPLCYKPKDTTAFSDINKVEFKFDLSNDKLATTYLDIDNMLFCM